MIENPAPVDDPRAVHCRDCAIRSLVLFADLVDADFDLLQPPVERLEVAAGAILYHEEEKALAMFTIRDGLVKLVQTLPDGSERVVRLLRRGDVAGLEASLGEAYEHTAVALRPSRLCRLPRLTIRRLLEETPRLQQQLMRRWHESVRAADLWLTGLSTGPARARVARLVLWLMEQETGTCHLFGRENMGAMLGVTTETASRTIARFKRDGLLREIAPNHFACDREALETLASEG